VHVVVRSGSGLRFNIVFGGVLEDPCRRDDGRLGRLEDGCLSGRSPGEEGIKAAPAGICGGCLQYLSALERSAEHLVLCLTGLLPTTPAKDPKHPLTWLAGARQDSNPRPAA